MRVLILLSILVISATVYADTSSCIFSTQSLTADFIEHNDISEFVNKNLEDVKLDGLDIDNANFSKSCLRFTSFKKADLDEANFSGSVAEYADFVLADLDDSDFRDANLSYAYFNKADLRRADFRGARFWNTELFRADMRGADFRGTFMPSSLSMGQADLRKADLRGASFCISKVDCEPRPFAGYSWGGALVMALHSPPKMKGAKFDDCTRFKGVSLERQRQYGESLGMIFVPRPSSEGECAVTDENRGAVYSQHMSEVYERNANLCD